MTEPLRALDPRDPRSDGPTDLEVLLYPIAKALVTRAEELRGAANEWREALNDALKGRLPHSLGSIWTDVQDGLTNFGNGIEDIVAAVEKIAPPPDAHYKDRHDED